MSRLPSPPSMSRADLALKDGSLFANLRYASLNHAEMAELLGIVATKVAAAAAFCDGTELVSELLDQASDLWEDNVYVADPAQRAEAAREIYLELVHDDRRSGL